MSHPRDETSPPIAPAASPRNTVRGVLVAAIVAIVVATIVGLVLAYLASFVVVKLGLPAPMLVIVLPLLVTMALAWAMTGGQRLRDGVLTVLVAGALAGALFALWAPSSPSSMFAKESKVTDVQVRGDRADITLESKRTMKGVPPFGATLGYAALLACFVTITATLAHGAVALRSRRG